MANPVAGQDYPRAYQEFVDWFPDDRACVEYQAGLRWPDGFVCPACGNVQYWWTGNAQWMCSACSRKTSIIDFATQVIEPGSTIRTDGATVFRRLADLGYTHEPTVAIGNPDQDSIVPGVHQVASLLKRWLTGTLHYRVERHQMPYYLDEYTFRFNLRRSRSRGLLFYRLLQQATNTDPHPLHELRGARSK